MSILDFFKDDAGILSSTRLMNFCLVMGYLAWATKIVWATGVIPDMPLQLTGLVVTLYGINKIGGNIIANKENVNE